MGCDVQCVCACVRVMRNVLHAPRGSLKATPERERDKRFARPKLTRARQTPSIMRVCDRVHTRLRRLRQRGAVRCLRGTHNKLSCKMFKYMIGGIVDCDMMP